MKRRRRRNPTGTREVLGLLGAGVVTLVAAQGKPAEGEAPAEDDQLGAVTYFIREHPVLAMAGVGLGYLMLRAPGG